MHFFLSRWLASYNLPFLFKLTNRVYIRNVIDNIPLQAGARLEQRF
jgi:hypothetical protein